MAKTKAAKPPGRPAIYAPAIAETILERLMDGQSLRKICEDEAMPSRSTVLRWLAADTEGFEAKYARARVAQLMGEADALLELADQSRIGMKTTTKGNGDIETVEGDMIERTRMQIETRKWLLEKLIPKKYGAKLELSGDPTNPIQHSVTIGPEEAYKRMLSGD